MISKKISRVHVMHESLNKIIDVVSNIMKYNEPDAQQPLSKLPAERNHTSNSRKPKIINKLKIRHKTQTSTTRTKNKKCLSVLLSAALIGLTEKEGTF